MVAEDSKAWSLYIELLFATLEFGSVRDSEFATVTVSRIRSRARRSLHQRAGVESLELDSRFSCVRLSRKLD